jgi:predicted DNA-binding transcriptional regulator AlpA
MNENLKESIGNTQILNADYHGQHGDGRQRVVIDGKKAYVTCALHMLAQIEDDDGRKKTERSIVSVSPNYQPNADHDLAIDAVCVKTGVKYQLIGKLTYCKPKALPPSHVCSLFNALPSPIPLEASGEIVCNIISADLVRISTSGVKASQNGIDDVDNCELDSASIQKSANQPENATSASLSEEIVNEGKVKSKMRTLENFISELASISAHRQAGLDPDVKVAFIVQYVHESHANLYRKMAAGLFPKPIKRGRGSFWPMSQVEAYKRGEYKC